MPGTGTRAWKDWRNHAVLAGLLKVLDIAKTIATIDIKTDGVEGVSKRTPFLTEEQMAIKPLFDLRSLLDN